MGDMNLYVNQEIVNRLLFIIMSILISRMNLKSKFK